MDEGRVLEILRGCGALLEGHFELRSGLHSDRFFQCANVLQHPPEAEELCRALAQRLRAGMDAGGVQAQSVIAPALGGVVVGHEVARALGLRSIFVEKQEGRLALRRFEIEAGERFIVAEDVVTRGGRVRETVDIVEAAGGEVMAIGVLVDRSGGKADFGHPLASLLEMEPVTYEPGACPLCEKGLALVHPGS